MEAGAKDSTKKLGDRRMFLEHLGRIGSEEAVDTLVRILDSLKSDSESGESLSRDAFKALAEIDRVDTLPHLVGALKDPDLRYTSVKRLRQLTGLNFDYKESLDPESKVPNEKAIRQWEDWWQKNKDHVKWHPYLERIIIDNGPVATQP
jgi:HEAT repeat protein